MKSKITQWVFVGVILTMVNCRSSTNNDAEVMKMQCEVTGSGTPIVLVPGGLIGWVS